MISINELRKKARRGDALYAEEMIGAADRIEELEEQLAACRSQVFELEISKKKVEKSK